LRIEKRLTALQFFRQSGYDKNKTVAATANWNTHPESMESRNTR